MSQGYFHKLRVGVVVFHQDHLLLLRQNNLDFWVLPGGTVEGHESLAEAAEREMLEETALAVSIRRLLWVSDFIPAKAPSTGHVVDVVFWGSITGGTLSTVLTENINEMRWVSKADLSETVTNSVTLQPRKIEALILTHWESLSDISANAGLREHPVNGDPYLGLIR
ncbi:MAG: NUDIX hydrolase [Cyanobacteria bacterium]|nr:NUDIX hydrolase [Cyanobacteriota bacterium]